MFFVCCQFAAIKCSINTFLYKPGLNYSSLEVDQSARSFLQSSRKMLQEISCECQFISLAVDSSLGIGLVIPTRYVLMWTVSLFYVIFSCWEVNHHPSLRSFSTPLRFYSWYAVYLVPIKSNQLSNPSAEKDPKSMMLILTCFTIREYCRKWWTALLSLHIKLWN